MKKRDITCFAAPGKTESETANMLALDMLNEVVDKLAYSSCEACRIDDCEPGEKPAKITISVSAMHKHQS